LFFNKNPSRCTPQLRWPNGQACSQSASACDIKVTHIY
jgi:hypothetical protein